MECLCAAGLACPSSGCHHEMGPVWLDRRTRYSGHPLSHSREVHTDCCLTPGRLCSLPGSSNWHSEGPSHRRRWDHPGRKSDGEEGQGRNTTNSPLRVDTESSRQVWVSRDPLRQKEEKHACVSWRPQKACISTRKCMPCRDEDREAHGVCAHPAWLWWLCDPGGVQ